MNSASDTDPTPMAPPPANWREALVALVASRVALFEVEAKEAAKVAARRAILLGAGLFCVFFMWALLLAGGIAGLAHALGWPWYGLAMGAAVLHLGGAVLLAKVAQSPTPPAFPVTRAEFKKDRQWIENLQKTRKSNV